MLDFVVGTTRLETLQVRYEDVDGEFWPESP